MATQQDIADHLDLTTRWVRKLVKEGVLPSSKGRGGYDLEACRMAYIRYLRGVGTGQVSGSTQGGDEESENWSDLLEREKYREKKRQNDLEEKKVAPVSLLTDALVQAGNIIIPILESLPLVMKRNWPEITGDQILLVKKAIGECRNAIADSELEIQFELEVEDP